jgi:hypothetical protein
MAQTKKAKTTDSEPARILRPKSIEPEESVNGEKQIWCTKGQLAVLGTAQTMGAAPWEDPGFEIWGVAQCAVFEEFKRADILFELHTRDYWGDENVRSRLNTWGGRLIMHEHYDEVPRSERFPIDTILQYRGYHRTSITYMLALAYHSFKLTGNPWHVGLFGIHMEDVQEEYGEQRPCCEYWLGRMEDAGMNVFISGGAILSSPFLYGYEKYSPLVWKLRQRHDGLMNGVQVKQDEHREKGYEVHRQIGAAQECDYWLRLAQRGELTFDSIDTEMKKAQVKLPGVNTTALVPPK